MNNIWMIVIVAISGYLIGSISMSRIVTRIVSPETNLEDVEFSISEEERYQLRTISATTASLALGPKVGGIITILDALKAVIPSLILRFLYPDQYYYLIAPVFAVIGHNWSIFFRFTGGGGMSVAYGAFFTIAFFGTLISAFSGMLLGFLVFKDMMIAFISGPFLVLVWLIIFKGDWPHILFGIAINAIIIIKLIPDIIVGLKDYKENREKISRIMDQTGMGRMMKKMIQLLGVDPEKEKKEG